MKRAFTIWQLVLLLAGMVLLAAVLYPLVARAREPVRDMCQSQLKRVVLGLKQYAQDYEETYPLVASSSKSYGWADAAYPYVKSRESFQCVDEKKRTSVQPNPRLAGYTDYWMSEWMSAAAEWKLKTPERMVLLGEGNDGSDTSDARYSLRTVPDLWVCNIASPLYRHRSGANFAFVDGHVKRILGDQVQMPYAFGEYSLKP